jgi:N-acetylneuraminic acid mutarotase
MLLLIASAIPVVSAGTNRLNLQTRIVDKTSGVNINTVSPACVKSGQDTCDFRIRIWNSSSSTNTTPTTGNLMFTQTFQDVEIGDTDGIINLSLNSCGSTQVGLSQWGTSVGTCAVQLDNANTGSPGVDFSRSDLWIEFSFAPADTVGSLGSFTEVFSRSTLDQVPSAISADTLNGLRPSDFVQFAPSATQVSTSTNSLVNLQTTASTSSPLLLVNENGSGTPDLLRLQVAGNNKLLVTNAGGISTTATATATSTTTTGTGTSSTVLTVSSTASFAVGDLIFVNGTNFARVVSIDTTSRMTISPGISWGASQSVVKYSTPNIGDASNIANRYNQGFFLNGVVTGSGTAITEYSEREVSTIGNFAIKAQDLNIGTLGQTNINTSALRVINNQQSRVSDSWSAEQQGGTPRYLPSTVLYNGIFYIWGGSLGGLTRTNLMEQYDLNSNKWSSGVSGGTARDYHTAVVYNNKMYGWGGRNASAVEINSMDIFDYRTNTWSVGTAGGTARHLHSAVVYNDKMYIWAGSPATIAPLNTMDIYDFATSTWSVGTAGGTARYSATAVVYNNKLYVWGGQNSGLAYINTMDIFDFATNVWTTGTTGGTGRFAHQAVVSGNRMYVWGGFNGGTLNSLDIFNLATNTWSTGLAGGTARYQHTSVVSGNKIYNFGGYNGTTYFTSVDIYDIALGTWSTGVSGGTAKRAFTSSVYQNKVYNFGGYDGTSVLNTMNVFDFGSYDTIFSLYAGLVQKLKVDTAGNTHIAGTLRIGDNSTSTSRFVVNAGTGESSHLLDLQIGGVSTLSVNSAGDIRIADGSTKNIVDSAGNNLVQITDIATNFGASLEAGAVISRNSYFGEEFMRARAAVAADTLISWGDSQSFGVDVNTACIFSTFPDSINGFGRITVNSAGSACLGYQSDAATANNPNLMYQAANLPLLIMKVRPTSGVGANDRVYVGFGNAGTASTVDPTAGIYFSNNSGTTWTGVTRNASVSTNVTCTGATVSTTQFALLKIEVRATTDVRFYVDPDVSNGVQWTTCGTSSTNIPTAPLTSMLQFFATVSPKQLDIDYYRVWQDDAPASPSATPEIAPSESPTPTIEVNEESPEITPSITITPTVTESLTDAEKEAIDNLAKLTGLRFESLGDAAEIKISPSLSLNAISLTAPQVKVKGNLIVNGMLEVVGDLFVRGNLTVDGTITAKNLQLQEQLSPRGTIKIDANKSSASVTFTKEFPTTPFILVEPKGEYIPFSVTNKTEKGFIIEIKEPATKELTFEWIAVQ